jgi:hypothetical protein
MSEYKDYTQLAILAENGGDNTTQAEIEAMQKLFAGAEVLDPDTPTPFDDDDDLLPI